MGKHVPTGSSTKGVKAKGLGAREGPPPCEDAAVELGGTDSIRRIKEELGRALKRTAVWGTSGYLKWARLSGGKNREYQQQIQTAFFRLFTEDPDIRELYTDEAKLDVSFRVVQYGHPCDDAFTPGVELINALKGLLLQAFVNEGDPATSRLPVPKQEAGLLVATVILREFSEYQRAQRQVTEEIEEAFNEHVAFRLEHLRQDAPYAQVKATALALQSSMRAALAKAVEPSLNAQLRSMPHTTYDDKREVAKWLNAELRQLGLAIQCPKTGRPAFLVADPGGKPGIGRFQLEVTTETGKPHRSVSTASLPALTYIGTARSGAEPPSPGMSR